MPGFCAFIVPLPVNHPHIVGSVSALDRMTTAVICHLIDGEWVPQYGIVTKSEDDPNAVRIELPSCFTLDPEAKEALECLWKESHA